MTYSRANLHADTFAELCQLRDMANPPRIHVICTGAGSQLQNTLWRVPGASKYMVGGMFPYATEATVDLLGWQPTKFVSYDVAYGLAQRAYQEAVRAKRPGKVVGVGVTSSVASQEVHRGNHVAIAVAMTADRCYMTQYQFKKGTGVDARDEDDLGVEVVALKAMFALLRGYGVVDRIQHRDFAEVEAHEVLRDHRTSFMRLPFLQADGKRFPMPENGHNMILLPGTFNPLHYGHRNMAEELVRFGRQVVFTIECAPPHKPALSLGDMLERANQFRGLNLLFTEGLPLYIDKARAFPGVELAMGADSLERMLDPKWGHDPGMLLAEFRKLESHLYVFDRTIKGVKNRGMKVLDKIGMRHYGASGLMTSMDEEWPEISSTQLRSQSNG